MSSERDLTSIAKAIIDSNVYMTLGTADAEGRPWVSPVYFSAAGYADFFWMSSPEARHSRNISVRPRISIVIFDSRAAVGSGQGVYLSATASELTGTDVERGLETYPGPPERGAREVTRAEVTPPGIYRLYRARAERAWTLDPGASPDRRAPVSLDE